MKTFLTILALVVIVGGIILVTRGGDDNPGIPATGEATSTDSSTDMYGNDSGTLQNVSPADYNTKG
jgi:hypothetical protein